MLGACDNESLTDTHAHTIHLIRSPLPQIRENSAVKLVGQPEDIAGLVSYLVSDESRFITGRCYRSHSKLRHVY